MELSEISKVLEKHDPSFNRLVHQNYNKRNNFCSLPAPATHVYVHLYTSIVSIYTESIPVGYSHRFRARKLVHYRFFFLIVSLIQSILYRRFHCIHLLFQTCKWLWYRSLLLLPAHPWSGKTQVLTYVEI